MAKRTKKAKSSRSNLRVETLEQRQLLATIVAGSGVEVASNIDLPNGRYDQILMTGASVTVAADPGEVVRVSFLDQGGDIVQAEFAGKGTMTVSLEDVKTAASAGYTNKNPDQFLNGSKVNYVQGLATITVDKPELNTNLGVYAAGILQNPGFFTGQAKQGDNGLADIARVVLVGNPNNEAGYSVMGGIRMGGAVFSAATGVVGIRGENVAIQDIVAIGDIDAKESGVPTLMFNTNSQFQTVFVRGGDLRQTNGASFDSFGAGNGGAPGGSPGNGNNITLGGFSFFNSTDGTTSAGTKLWATPVNQAAIRLATVDQQTLVAGDWVFDWTNPQAVKVTQNGTDVSSVYGGDWLAKGGIQASLDYAFERRTFQGNLTIKGDLPANYEMNVADARGNVTFENNLFGRFTVDGFGASIDGTLTINGNLDGTVIVQGLDRTGGFDGQQNKINAIVVGGSTGAFTDVRAEDIGNITIVGNMSGIFSTDVTRGNAWTPTSGAKTATGYVDVEGFIGDISVGYNAAGASTGGSIINGTFQGNSGIGNVKVGGDIWGSPQNQAVFETVSNAGAAPTDVRNYGSANIGTITVRGDVDLDSSSDRLIFINGNGTFGNINVQGLTTTNTVPGPQTGTKTDLIPGSETFVRILSPFTDKGFVPTPATGQKLVNNYDPDGAAGALNDTYFVTKADVAAGAMIYDLVTAKMVAAKEGDRVPVLVNGAPIPDGFGSVVYTQNTALFEGKTQTVPVFGPDVVTIVSGNRGTLDGVFNNFGRIQIAGLLGAQQKTTGSITWTDSVDMNFGGITVNSAGNNNQGVIGTVGTIGQISITNTSGATSDLVFSGVMGSPNGSASNANVSTAQIGLTGLTAGGFEDVRFAQISGNNNFNNIIHATEVKNGVSVTTVAGSGNGQGVGTVSPSILFDSRILLDNGTSEAAQTALLSLNTGMTNSQIQFANGSGIVVNDGPNTGNGSAIGAISLASDYVRFDGTLSAKTIGAITLTGGKGIASNSDTGVSFTGSILGNTVGAITGSASEGNVVFAPTTLTGLFTNNTVTGNTPHANVASITLTTAGTNNGGDITLGNSSTYNANVGDVTLTGGHKLFLSQAGTVIDNPGNITVNFGTSGNVGNVTATTTTGDINNALVIQGNVGNITYTAGAAVVDKADLYGGAIGDLARWGSISATQTIWGTRGVTTMETAGQKADGSAATLDFTVNSVNYKILPGGTINATVNYAGASTAAGDAFIAKTGGGNATVNYNIIGNDDNVDGVLAISEIGHGGNASVSSISGDITFAGGTQLTDYTHVATLGNVALKTGTFAQASGLIAAGQRGDITLSFNDLAGAPATGGFEGATGNISATTTAGNITFGQSRFDGKVGDVTLTTGAVVHTGGVTAGNISTGGTGVTFNTGQGLVKNTVTDIGTITATFNANGPQAATGNGFEFVSQYGAINATVGAGWYDANNNGLFTADEFGRTGDLSFISQGGALNITLNSNKYVSDLEQSIIGNVTAKNTSYIDVKNGATDVINGTGTSALGSAIVGATGAITITGANTQVGAVGNLKGDTTIGTITHTGLFGDLGTATFNTTSYSDVDTNPNSTAEAAVLLASGNIAIGTGGFNGGIGAALVVNGKHGLATYNVIEDGAITGTAYYGGMATGADSLKADSVRGNIALAVWLQDADRDGSGQITANEYGTHGTSKLATTSGGDITLALGTEQNNAAVAARNLVSQFTFGAVTATAADRYTSTSATAADVLADAGNITITGAGADATNAFAFGPVTGNRGNVDSVTASTTQGNITLNGQFGGLGDQTLTVTRYVDVNGANSNTFAGAIAYSPSIWGTHGTATLRTTDTGFVGTGTPTGGAITGTAIFGGALAAGKTVSIDAATQRANITLDVFARGFDVNGDTKVTDGVSNNVPGDFEFAKVGLLKFETTNAGDITLGLAAATADGSTVGASIGNVSAIADDDIYTIVNNGADTAANLGNVTVTGKAPAASMTGGTIGDILMTVSTGDNTLTGNFVNIGGVTMNTGTYNDAGTGTLSGIIAAGDIILGNNNTGADNAFADTAGLTTLNIAGTYKSSTLTVTEQGTITGEVFSAGSAGEAWILNAGRGAATAASSTANGVSGTAIDVNFVAGFDRDDADADGASGIDNGTFGAITATSNFGNVTIGVGGRSSGSSVGAVTVTTGSSIVDVSGTDRFTHGTAEIQGLSSHITGKGADNTYGTNDDPLSFSGTVGALTASSPLGTAQITGDFNNIGAVTLTGDARLDSDSNSAVAGEDDIVAMAGDVNFGTVANPVYVGGTYGAITLKTVDSTKLAPAFQAKAGLVGNFGTINSTAFFGATTANTFSATSDRGAIVVDLEAGFDKNNSGALADGGVDNNRSTGEDSGAIGALTLTSKSGNITATLDSASTGSSYGAVVITTGSEITSLSGADTVVQVGAITIQGNNDGETANGNLGTIASITANTGTGNITLNGSQWNVGAINLTTSSSIDVDSNSAVVGEDPTVNGAGSIILGYTSRVSHGTITATTADLSTGGVLAGTQGSITGTLNFSGSLAAGSTNSFVASTQQGTINVAVNSQTFERALDNGLTAGNTSNNADNFVGAVGNLSLTSLFGDINVDPTTSSLAKIGTDTAIRFSSIGSITASTGTSYKVNAGASNDTLVIDGDITIGVNDVSNGILGAISATTVTGDININSGGTFNNVIGAVTATTGSYSDTTVLDSGNITFGGSYATTNNNSGDFDTILGAVSLNAAGSVANDGLSGSAGNITVNANFGGAWTDADTDVTIDSGERALFSGGAFNATVTDGTISYTVASNTAGYGATLPDTLLKSTGGSTFGTTGNISTGGTGAFTSINSFKMEAADGALSYNSTWSTPLVNTFSMVSDKGTVSFDQDLLLNTPNATDFNATQAKIANFTLEAKNGAVNVTGNADLGNGDIVGILNRANLGTANDTRTFVLENITLKSAGASGGTINVTGVIGGTEITGITNLVFDVPALTGKTTLNGAGASPAILAHDITKITFNGNVDFTGATEILASDIQTTRTRIGSVDYDANTAADADNKGSNLDTIGELIFNGSVAGNANASLITGNRAEIEASQIGKITIEAPVDPTTTVKYSVQDLDILASNSRGGIAQGEALIVAGYSTLDAASAITAFNIGDISVRHSLQGNSVGSTVFAGSNAFAGIGGTGKFTVTSTVSGTVQAPMLTATGGIWLAVGDADGLGNATANFDTTGVGAAVAYDDVATGTGVGDKVSIGAVSIDVGSSYAPPAVQNQDFGNVGGSNAVATDGFAILAAAIAPTVADTAATRVAAATELYGYVTSVEIKNAGIRPDADGTDFAVTAGAAFPAGPATGDGNLGAFIAVAGDGDTNTSDIGDIINDLNPALVPLVEGQARILGRVGVATEYDQHEVVVYVL